MLVGTVGGLGGAEEGLGEQAAGGRLRVQVYLAHKKMPLPRILWGEGVF